MDVEMMIRDARCFWDRVHRTPEVSRYLFLKHHLLNLSDFWLRQGMHNLPQRLLGLVGVCKRPQKDMISCVHVEFLHQIFFLLQTQNRDSHDVFDVICVPTNNWMQHTPEFLLLCRQLAERTTCDHDTHYLRPKRPFQLCQLHLNAFLL